MKRKHIPWHASEKSPHRVVSIQLVVFLSSTWKSEGLETCTRWRQSVRADSTTSRTRIQFAVARIQNRINRWDFAKWRRCRSKEVTDVFMSGTGSGSPHSWKGIPAFVLECSTWEDRTCKPIPQPKCRNDCCVPH